MFAAQRGNSPIEDALTDNIKLESACLRMLNTYNTCIRFSGKMPTSLSRHYPSLIHQIALSIIKILSLADIKHLG